MEYRVKHTYLYFLDDREQFLTNGMGGKIVVVSFKEYANSSTEKYRRTVCLVEQYKTNE